MSLGIARPFWTTLVGTLAVLFQSSLLQAATLSWDANNEPDLAGYKLFYGETNSAPKQVDVGISTSRDCGDLLPGHSYYFYVKAYNSLGQESDSSEQISYTVPIATLPLPGQPPAISFIPDLTIPEDAPHTAIEFTVEDIDTAASNLVLSAVSLNPNLILSETILLSGSGTSRIVALRPVGDRFGIGGITVSVSDGEFVATRTFNVNVIPINDAPLISDLQDRTILLNGSTGTMPLIVQDKETDPALLAVTVHSSDTLLLPQSGLLLGGTGSNRTLTITPALNQIGQATVTVTVGDGELSSSDVFNVTVQGTPTQNYFLMEGFERNGYENSGWIEIGKPNENYKTLALQGTESLRCYRGEQVYRALTRATNANLFFNAYWSSVTTGHRVVTLTDRTAAPSAYIWLANSRLRIHHGTVTATGSTTLSPNVTYNVWLEWTKGSGPDGTMRLYISSSSVKPSSPEASISAGNGGFAEQLYLGSPTSDAPSVIYDALHMADIPIGTNPTNPTSTIQPLNKPPFVQIIPDQNTVEDSPDRTIAFGIGDPDTAIANLIVTAASSNTNLIPNMNLTLGGSGTNRTLSFRPVSNGFGSTEISIRVNDGEWTSSDTFVINVSPVNDSPSINDLPDRTVLVNQSTGPISVKIGDVDTSPGSLILTVQSSNPILVPQSGMALGGSGEDRTLTITPAMNQTGQATITITVSDGALSVSDTFQLTVQSGLQTFLLAEKFEGLGYENAGWFEVGTPNENYTSLILEGTQSLRCSLGEQVYRMLNGATNLNLYFMVHWRNWLENHTVIDLSNPQGSPSGFLWASNGRLSIYHGTASATCPMALSAGVTYHVWVEWTKGTGDNGSMNLFVSSTATKPATPGARITTGNGGISERLYFGAPSPTAPSIVFDRVHMANSPIGSNPGQ
jgi:hypothetical protein